MRGMWCRVFRYSIVLAVGCAITLVLFYVMGTFIGRKNDATLDETSVPNKLDGFVREPRRDEIIETKETLPEQRDETETAPCECQMITQGSSSFGDGPPLNVGQAIGPEPDIAITPSIELILPGLDDSFLDSEMRPIPLERVMPIYPADAVNSLIEGWVELIFTISETGLVKNAEVVNSFPKGVFEESALMAINKWRYSPRREDGHSVETPEVLIRFIFDLSDIGIEKPGRKIE